MDFKYEVRICITTHHHNDRAKYSDLDAKADDEVIISD
jgi:hypothetical protein